MAIETSQPRSRRALLGAVIGAAVVNVAHALGRPTPALAAGEQFGLTESQSNNTTRWLT